MTLPAGVPRRAILAAAAALLLAAGALALVERDDRSPPLAPRADAAKPTLLLVTTLPLIFGEAFSLEGGGSPALDALESRYRVLPIGVAGADALEQGRLLVMAHAMAQPAEALVSLDAWVRGGGRVLILADPLLEWPSSRPLGDRLRPPPAFADTGLLAHWGLELVPPEEPGPVGIVIAGRDVRTRSVGTIRASNPECPVAANGLVARCSIGAGRATVVADADFLDVDAAEGAGGSGNLQFLLSELQRLER